LKKILVFFVAAATPLLVVVCLGVVIQLIDATLLRHFVVSSVWLIAYSVAFIIVGPFITGEIAARLLRFDSKSTPLTSAIGAVFGIILLIALWDILKMNLERW
jgi:hypothetical protein